MSFFGSNNEVQIGEVQANPTANTVLGRLKDLLTGIVLAAGNAIIGKVGIDQTTDGTTNRVVAKISQVAGENAVVASIVGSLANDITFHDEATAVADGTALTIDGEKTLVVEILSTATSFTIAFKGEGASGADISLMGVNLSDFSTGTSTSTSGQLWQFDITGLTKVFMDLTAITAGVGSVTVKGRAVA